MTTRRLESWRCNVEAKKNYGYYCYGMDCGVIRVTVTNARRIKIADKYNKYDRNEGGARRERT